MEQENLLDRLVVSEIKTQSDYLADKIKDMIVSRDLTDGFTFPNENDFCRQLNVSRSTLREAYKILDTQGFIKRTKHGTYVKGREDIANQGNFTASLELADKQEMEEFVCALEPEAVYLAAKKAGEEDLATLRQLMHACEDLVEEPKKFVAANYRFHAFIREMAQNTLITSALSAYYDAFNHQVIESIYYQNTDVEEFKQGSLVEHRQLYELIRAHQAEEAKALAYRHLVASVEFENLRF